MIDLLFEKFSVYQFRFLLTQIYQEDRRNNNNHTFSSQGHTNVYLPKTFFARLELDTEHE